MADHYAPKPRPKPPVPFGGSGVQLPAQPIPPFTRCPTCGSVAMLLRPGLPHACAHCLREK